MKTDAEVLAEATLAIGEATQRYVGAPLNQETLARMRYELSDILYSLEMHENPSWRGDIEVDISCPHYNNLKVTLYAKNERAREFLEKAYRLIDASYKRGPNGNDS